MMSSSRIPALRPLRRMSSIQAFLTNSLRLIHAKKSTRPLPPILRLPCELFVYILEFVQEFEWLSHDSRTRESRWLCFCLVCHAWRIVILDSPSLWCFIEFTTLPWTRLMLERSANLSSIDMSYSLSRKRVLNPVHDDIVNIRLLLDNIHRTRRLFLFNAALRLLLRHAGNSYAMPLLETLVLRASDSRSYWMYDLPDDVFAKADRLRVLELADINIPSSSSLFRPNLIKLSLHRQEPTYLGYSLTEMINVLRNMSSLEELSIHSWIKEHFGDNDVTDTNLDPQSTIVFPQLQLFEFTCNTLFECARFIQLLSLPQTTCIHLHCISDPLAEAILPLSYLPQQHLNGLSPLPLTKLTIFYLGMQVKIHGSPSTTDVHRNTSGAFELDVCIPSTHHAISGAGITHILSPLHLLSVTSLTLYSGSLSIDWSPTLVMLQSVEEINVLGCKWDLFVRALSTVMPIQAQHAIGQGVQMPCPCLRRLQFTHLCDLHSCKIADPLFLESLAIVLDMRRTGGIPVEEIVIQGEHVSLNDLRTLKMTKHGEVWGNSARS